MLALLKKDLPWLLFCLVGGLVGLTIALVQDGPLQVFVLGASRLQGGFHVSWIAGMLLGGIAGCFDELLGTREFLQQRPIAAGRLALSRLLGCGLVLMTWTLVAPVLAWTWAQLFDDRVPLGEFGGWPQWLATNSVAWSACAIGLCAASLPLRGPLRLLVAFVVFYGGFLVVHQMRILLWVPGVARTPSRAEWVFGVSHIVLAMLIGGVAWVAQQTRRDVDRSSAATVRSAAVPLLLVAATVFANCCVVELQSGAVSMLHYTYPYPKQIGREIVLVSHYRDEAQKAVDADHRPIDRPLTGMQDLGFDRPWVSRDNEFQEPSWNGSREHRYAEGVLWQALDGRVWGHRHGAPVRQVRWGGKPAEFVPQGRLANHGKATPRVVFVEVGAPGLWLFEPERMAFQWLPTPDGGRVLDVDPGRAGSRASARGEQVPAIESRSLVLGERANYALVGNEMVVDSVLELARPRPQSTDSLGWGMPFARQDPLDFTVSFAATADRDAFKHMFTPRTSRERYYATQALAWSLLRPPVAQIGGHVIASWAWPGWLLDALVIDGRRTWLVLTNAALWLLVAFGVARRLRRIGAPRGVVRGWALATALLGPVVLLASVVLERPRAFADRRAITPPAPPRIASLPTTAPAS